MAQNVTINGQNYSAVPAVQIPKTGGGTAQFTDVSDTTAVAADVISGKYFYLANGSKVSGSKTIYAVTDSLTHVDRVNGTTSIVGGDSFYTELIPDEGYLITSVTVTMGGVDITDQVFTGGLGAKSITANGIYNAADDNLLGYSKVNVNIQNSYSASDEGKVVSNGALISQGSDNVTANGIYDTTLIKSLTINVPSGGSNTDPFLVIGGANQFKMPQNGLGRAIYSIDAGRTRSSLWCLGGDIPPALIYDGTTASYTALVETSLYPVPIPSGSANVKVSTTHSGQYDIFFVHHDSGSGYVTDSTTGWVNVSGSNVAIPANSTHIICMHRVSSSQPNYNASTFPSDLKLVFS